MKTTAAVLFLILASLSLANAQDFNATLSSNDTLQAEFNSTAETMVVTTTKLPVNAAADTSSVTLATTPASANANIFQLKTICSCQMDSLADSEMITCPNNFKINIVSAVVYDMNNTRCEKSENTVQAGYLASIKEDLANYCTGTNCSISQSHIIGSVDITNRKKEVVCLTVDIKWFCYQFTSKPSKLLKLL